jgi:hypothetical protein
MVDELKKDVAEAAEESHGNSVALTCVTAQIRTQHLPNTSLEFYLYTNLFSLKIILYLISHRLIMQQLLLIHHMFRPLL